MAASVSDSVGSFPPRAVKFRASARACARVPEQLRAGLVELLGGLHVGECAGELVQLLQRDARAQELAGPGQARPAYQRRLIATEPLMIDSNKTSAFRKFTLIELHRIADRLTSCDYAGAAAPGQPRADLCCQCLWLPELGQRSARTLPACHERGTGTPEPNSLPGRYWNVPIPCASGVPSSARISARLV